MGNLTLSISCVWDLVLAHKVEIGSHKYEVTHKQTTSETLLHIIKENGRVFVGYIQPINKRCFKVFFRENGLDWETKIKFTSVRILDSSRNGIINI